MSCNLGSDLPNGSGIRSSELIQAPLCGEGVLTAEEETTFICDRIVYNKGGSFPSLRDVQCVDAYIFHWTVEFGKYFSVDVMVAKLSICLGFFYLDARSI